jgi:septum formation protein
VTPPLVLASGSPRRAELLARVGYAFDVVVPDVDETQHPGESVDAYASRLARAKAGRVWADRPGSVVVGADTVVVLDGTSLGKPADAVDALRMLRSMSGREHAVLTAVHVCGPDGTADSFTSRAVVRMAASDPATLAGYVSTGEPMDKAGAYGLQGVGAALVTGIDGDPTTVIGLPLQPTVVALRALGLPPPALDG